MTKSLFEAVMAAREAQQAPEEPKRDSDIEATMLRDYLEALRDEAVLAPGDIVRQKAGGPYSGDMYIVVELLPVPVIAEEDDSGSPYFRQKLDMVVGRVVGGVFALWHVESRRFEHWPAHEVQSISRH